VKRFSGTTKAEATSGIRIGIAVLVFALGGIAACATNPVTGTPQLSLMSEQQELEAGTKLYPLYTQLSYGLFQDEALQDYVNSIGQRLAAVSHRPNLPYAFNVVNSSDLNAYALPGGKISITRGMVARMENEAQLAGVLGHEIAHVAALHHLATYTRQVFSGLLSAVGMAALQTAAVPAADLIGQVGLLGVNLTLAKYSRDQERQADKLGMDYMARAGYNPAGFVQAMALLMDEMDRQPSLLESYFASHPLTSERVADANQRLSLYGPKLRTPEALREASFREATAYLRQVQPAYALMDQGKTAMKNGDSRQALQLFQEATVRAPREALIWVYRAVAEGEAGLEEQALQSAERAISLYPDLFHGRYVAGVLAFEGKDYTRSLTHLKAAERLIPGQPQVTFYQGRNFEAMGRREDAARAYYAVLQKVRKGPMAQYCYQRLVQWGYLRG
jgi:predicted Zn-dependent protease